MSQKLQEELQYEEEVAAQEAEEGEPTFLKDFKEAGNWKVRFSTPLVPPSCSPHPSDR